jgi:hypothetical protein
VRRYFKTFVIPLLEKPGEDAVEPIGMDVVVLVDRFGIDQDHLLAGHGEPPGELFGESPPG